MSASRGLDRLPEFASDRAIAEALVGRERAGEIVAMMPLFEREGFPPVDPRFRGRYVPAVRRFLDLQYGLADTPSRPRRDGEEHEEWTRPDRRRPRISA